VAEEDRNAEGILEQSCQGHVVGDPQVYCRTGASPLFVRNARDADPNGVDPLPCASPQLIHENGEPVCHTRGVSRCRGRNRHVSLDRCCVSDEGGFDGRSTDVDADELSAAHGDPSLALSAFVR